MPPDERRDEGHPQDQGDETRASTLLHTTGFLLSTAGRLLRERFEQAIMPTGLRARHVGVLASLDAWGPLPQGAVAQQHWMDKSTMVAVVDDLEAAGLVERRRNPLDRRSYELTLTDAGASKLAEATAAVARLEDEWFAALSDADRTLLRELLSRLLYEPLGLLPDAHARG